MFNYLHLSVNSWSDCYCLFVARLLLLLCGTNLIVVSLLWSPVAPMFAQMAGKETSIDTASIAPMFAESDMQFEWDLNVEHENMYSLYMCCFSLVCCELYPSVNSWHESVN